MASYFEGDVQSPEQLKFDAYRDAFTAKLGEMPLAVSADVWQRHHGKDAEKKMPVNGVATLTLDKALLHYEELINHDGHVSPKEHNYLQKLFAIQDALQGIAADVWAGKNAAAHRKTLADCLYTPDAESTELRLASGTHAAQEFARKVNMAALDAAKGRGR